MRPEDVIALVRKQPFVPFHLHLDDGTSFEIRHPDQIITTRHTLLIGVPEPDGAGVTERVVHCALLHVTRLEPEPQATDGS